MNQRPPTGLIRRLRFARRATQAGMVSERLLRAFWPLLSVIMATLAALMLGVQDHLPIEWIWAVAIGIVLLSLILLWGCIRRFHWPTRDEAIARLDQSLPGRPIQALIDSPAIGANDSQSRALWQAHQRRMADRAMTARPVQPDLKIARFDPYALRYMAGLMLVIALLFGSIWRVGSVTELTPGTATAATGVSWEGWIEPPRYTGLPTLYLNDIDDPNLNAPSGSRVILRLYGALGSYQVDETVSGAPLDNPDGAEQDFTITRSGTLNIAGPGGQSWDIIANLDLPPSVTITAPPELNSAGQMALPYEAEDDYAVTRGKARITLDMAALDRRHGLQIEPEPRPAIELDLPLPVSGNHKAFAEQLIEDFSQHPWANMPVTITLSVEDAIGQTTESEAYSAPLTARRFFDPMAAVVIEQRRDLLWSRKNASRIAQVLRAVSHRPDDVFTSHTTYLRLRVILRRLERFTQYGLTVDQRDELAAALWDLAVQLEEGNLSDALERLRQAQERLAEAMRNGASDQEIAELMQELRDATQDYLRQLAQQQPEDGEENQQSAENSLTLSQDDLQRMMDRVQELMEQGRMAEAEEALRELQELLDNMRVARNQGQNGQNEGDRAVEGLADTLREQQGLSDRAFRDLQEQFNPGARSGESQQNEGRSGGQGRGQSHSGQGGRGQGEGQQQGNGERSLADQQQALRDELGRQKGQLPGQGTPEGDAARDALNRAERAMDGAEQSLRDGDYADAIDKQSEAMEALREGMRSLGQALAQQQNPQGQRDANPNRQAQSRDPLGRVPGLGGGGATEDSVLQGQDVYRRARRLLDEVRRRAGESERPAFELDYLRRLLDRF